MAPSHTPDQTRYFVSDECKGKPEFEDLKQSSMCTTRTKVSREASGSWSLVLLLKCIYDPSGIQLQASPCCTDCYIGFPESLSYTQWLGKVSEYRLKMCTFFDTAIVNRTLPTFTTCHEARHANESGHRSRVESRFPLGMIYKVTIKEFKFEFSKIDYSYCYILNNGVKRRFQGAA
jgi:hypothetical protein